MYSNSEEVEASDNQNSDSNSNMSDSSPPETLDSVRITRSQSQNGSSSKDVVHKSARKRPFEDVEPPKLKLSSSSRRSTFSFSVEYLKKVLGLDKENRKNVEKICPRCDEKSENTYDYNCHLMKHNFDDSTCGICGKVLCSSGSRDRHILSHSNYQKYKCKYCNTEFTTNGNMNRHMQTHKHENQQTDTNDQSSSDENQAEESASTNKKSELPSTSTNSKKVNSKRNKSEKTENVANDLQAQSKVVEDYSDLYNVDFSSKAFPYVAQEACESTPKMLLESRQAYRCEICQYPFPCKSALELHTRKHETENSLCHKFCGDCLPSETIKDEHGTQHHNDVNGESNHLLNHLRLRRINGAENQPFQSLSCHYEASKDTIFDEGKDSEQNSLSDSSSKNECSNLSKQPVTESSGFKETKALRSSDNLSNSSQSSTSEMEIISAPISNDNDLADIKNMISNVNTVPPIAKPSRESFSCKLCNGVFTNKGNAIRHLYKVHKHTDKNSLGKNVIQNYSKNSVSSNTTMSKCQHCLESFETNEEKQRHVRSDRCTKKPFFCKICKVKFSKKHNIIRHIKKRHNVKSKEKNHIIGNRVLNNDNKATLHQNSEPIINENGIETTLENAELHKVISIPPQNENEVEEHCFTEAAAAAILLSLSESREIQEEPLDLSMRAVDLSNTKSSSTEMQKERRYGTTTSTFDPMKIMTVSINKTRSKNHEKRKFDYRRLPTLTQKLSANRITKKKYLPKKLMNNFHTEPELTNALVLSTERKVLLDIQGNDNQIEDGRLLRRNQVKTGSPHKTGTSSDLENDVDLAAIPSVISTANSSKFPSEFNISQGLNEINTDSHPNLDQESLTNKEKDFSCKMCTKTFPWQSTLLRHLVIHTGEKKI